MELVKKNWAAITLAVLAAVGAILAIVVLAEQPEFDFMGGAGMLGWLLFFIGMATYLVLKVFGMKPIASMVLLATGAVVTLLFVLNMIDGLGAEGMPFWLVAYMTILPLIAVGLFPLVKGCKKVFCNKENK